MKALTVAQFLTAGLFLYSCLHRACAEDLTITTYYPSPNGAYDALNVKRFSVGDTNADGKINASDVPASSGYLLVADRLGIGTSNPIKTLQVNDGVLIGDNYNAPSGTIFTNVSQAQLVLADTFNTGYNVGDNTAKLLITGMDNDALTAIYPIYVQDENGLVDFWLKNRQGASVLPIAYFGGNVGIGTTAPDNKLHLKGGSLEIESGDLRFYPDTSGSGAEFDYYNGQLYIGSNTEYSSQWNMVIQDSGNVGIGTTSPVYGKLEIRTTASNVGGLTLYRGTGATVRHWINSDDVYLIQRGTADTYGISIANTGKVGIGTTSPEQKLHVAGNIKLDSGAIVSGTRSNFYLALQGDRNMVLYDNGSAVWNSGTYTSDIRLKKNVKTLDEVLDKLKGIRGVRFNWKDKDAGESREIGVIAQEVEKVFPELVWTDPKSGYKLVKYDKLAPVLIEAIKEQQKEIEELRKMMSVLLHKNIDNRE